MQATSLAGSGWRRWRRVLAILVVGWLLTWSALVLLAWWVLPRLHFHPGDVGSWLSQRTGMPLQVHAVDARWTGRGPVLRLHGLRLGDQGQIQLGSAQWQLAVYDGLMPGRSLSELHLSGLDLAVRQADDGRWQIEGVSDSGSGQDPLDALSRLGELQLSGGRLHVVSPAMALDRVIPRVDLRLRVDGTRLRAGMKGWVHPDQAPVLASIDVRRDTGTGQLWLGSRALALANWPSFLELGGARLAGGHAGVDVWLSLRQWQLQSVTAQLDAEKVRVRAADGRSHRIASMQVLGQWKRLPRGWQMALPTLRIDGQVMDGLQMRWDDQGQIHVPHLSLAPLLPVLVLSDRLPDAARDWLQAADPDVALDNVHWQGTFQGHWQATADLKDVSFSAVGNAPGLSGLGGQLQVDRHGAHLELDAARQVVLDWPGGFGDPHSLHLRGGLGAWPEDDGWRLGVDALRVEGSDYAAWIRGGILFQNDGTRPRLDLAAQLDDALMPVAKRFWIRSKMSPAAIAWLDAALVAGHLRNGTGIVSGDLDDWPFLDNNGRFEARGHIANGTVHFADGWQPLEAVDAEVAFIGAGFELSGRGAIGGVPVTAFTAGIEHFSAPLLRVRAEGAGESGHLLKLLADSPLRKGREETFEAVSLAGPARVHFSLDQQLGNHPHSVVNGQVELLGNQLSDARWNLALDRVRGTVRYDTEGFSTSELQGRLEGQPARLTLRAGRGHVLQSAHALEARLAASHDMHQLLGRVPELSWLKPHLAGRSYWDIGLDMPAVAAAGKPAALLSLRSGLEGTRVDFPAPLDKPAAAALPLEVRVPLPSDSAPVAIALGDRLGMLVDVSGSAPAVLATLGSAQPQGPMPAQGLKVNGHSDRFDALGWVGLARGGEGGAGNALSLREVDLRTDALMLAGGRFRDTRVGLQPGNARIGVQLAGPDLAGQLTVPDTAGATVVGKLSRLHWQSASTATAVDLPPAPLSAATFHPADIPPLALDIEHFTVGNLALGSALVRTRPLSDGLQVDVLQLRSPGQSIDLQGSWRGRAENARTTVKVAVESGDIGALAHLLGQQGHLRGGQGTLQADAVWPGAPQDFTLSGLSGQLSLTARNGQLLEVDPGAGRVLGLLSIGQLPRRMMLDFRDLFAKGLAYNQIKADIAFDNGRATSRGIAIDAPAAQIQIAGHADLVQQRFEQTVEVNPRSGNLLTVVGAVAGGPVGAAVGAAANAVLSKPLGEIGARTYKVTGPWKDPQVEVIDRLPSQPASRTGVIPAPADNAAINPGIVE